ncbi:MULTISPECIES: hypothetical protein [Leeuwenhoekiella]|nr:MULTISPECIES: hypothetical protein [Leeuwenhoekiella]HBT11445.1 hypothetical protein [Leeuwenhoekiella sp.]
MKIIYFILIMSTSHNLSSQNLEGKWLLVVDETTYTVPSCIILEYENNTERVYEFNKVINEFPVEIDSLKKTIKKDSQTEFYRIIDNNCLEIITEENGSTKYNPRFVRITPTVLLNPFDLTKTLSFKEISGNSKNIKDTITINKSDLSPRAKTFSNYKFEDSFLKIVSWQNTYFLALKKGKKYQKIWPLQEIGEDYFILYGKANAKAPIKYMLIKN